MFVASGSFFEAHCAHMCGSLTNSTCIEAHTVECCFSFALSVIKIV